MALRFHYSNWFDISELFPFIQNEIRSNYYGTNRRRKMQFANMNASNFQSFRFHFNENSVQISKALCYESLAKQLVSNSSIEVALILCNLKKSFADTVIFASHMRPRRIHIDKWIDANDIFASTEYIWNILFEQSEQITETTTTTKKIVTITLSKSLDALLNTTFAMPYPWTFELVCITRLFRSIGMIIGFDLLSLFTQWPKCVVVFVLAWICDNFFLSTVVLQLDFQWSVFLGKTSCRLESLWLQLFSNRNRIKIKSHRSNGFTFSSNQNFRCEAPNRILSNITEKYEIWIGFQLTVN